MPERVAPELPGFHGRTPFPQQGKSGPDITGSMVGGILLQVGIGQIEQCHGGSKPLFLKMDERTGQLDEPFVKPIIRRCAAARQPEFLQDVVRLIVEAGVETIEVTGVLGRPASPLPVGDDGGDPGGFLRHEVTVAGRWRFAFCGDGILAS